MLKVKNCVIAGSVQDLDSTAGALWNITPWYTTAGWGNTTYADNASVMLTSPFAYENPNFRPAAGSPVLSGADFTDPALAAGFTSVAYRGAFGADDWTASWTNFNPDTASYTAGYWAVGLNEVKVNTFDMSVYPNPAANEFSVNFILKEQGDYTIQMSNLSGQIVYTEHTPLQKGFNALHLSSGNLPNGLYILKVSGANQIATRKVNILK